MGSGIEHLLAARRALRSSLEKTGSLSLSLSSADSRLSDIRQRLPSLLSSVRPLRADPSELPSVPSLIDRAVGPAAAVLRVFDALHGLEPSLLPSSSSSPALPDLPSFLSLVLRLEEALRFLSSHSPLALQWLLDILEFLHDHSLADPPFLSSLRSLLLSLPSPPPLDSGLLSASLLRLESHFRLLLESHTSPILLNSPSSASSAALAISPSPIPTTVLRDLLSIAQRLDANSRLDRCVAAYVDVRTANLRASLDALGLDYLQISTSDFSDVQSIEDHIANWSRHLEFAIKHLFEAEYRLCCELFEPAGPPELWTGCFADVAARAGILAFLRFGRTVTESKKDPIKLLKLLDIFGSLNRLRLDFNRLFGGKACAEIQELTRDLIRRVVEGSCEIFWELLGQVELQRQMPPPANGGVPKLVSFITDYCNRLLGDDYRPLLVQVLVIQRSWKQEKFQERLLDDAVLNIIKALEQDFEAWSKGYEDSALSYLFMMNTHWHFYRNLKGTRLGEMLGDSWLKEHEQYKEYYVVYYLRESWGKLPALLSREGLILFSGGRATARDLVKKRLKAFNQAFDEMYKRQSSWVIPDKELREKVCQLAIQAIVPAYRSYMQNYGPLVEQDGSASKYAKYTAQSLEQMLGSLFQQKPCKSISFKASQSNGKVDSVVACQYQPAPTVA